MAACSGAGWGAGRLGKWERMRNNFLLCPGWVLAISPADPSDICFLRASSDFNFKAKPAQPQPTGEKQVLSRFGHLDLYNTVLGR